MKYIRVPRSLLLQMGITQFRTSLINQLKFLNSCVA